MTTYYEEMKPGSTPAPSSQGVKHEELAALTPRASGHRPVNTRQCPVCRTGHSGPLCPDPDAQKPTEGERIFAELTAGDLAWIAREIGDKFGLSSVHCIAFEELAKRYSAEKQR